MTEISFHFNASEKYLHACRVIRKAVRGGLVVTVAGDGEALDHLDATLWSFSPQDFIPHCRIGAAPEVLGVTPVVLGLPQSGNPVLKEGQILLNIGADVPPGFERFQRLIELVGVHGDERQLGRARWKYYSARGYALSQHDLTGNTQ